MTANCGDPSLPSEGYLEPYISTTEGARVNIVHMCQNGQQLVEEIVCNPDRHWELINRSSCSRFAILGKREIFNMHGHYLTYHA